MKLAPSLLTVMLIAAHPAYAQDAQAGESPRPADAADKAASAAAGDATRAEDDAHGQALSQAARLLRSHHPKEALSLIDKVASAYEKKYADTTVYYCARTPAESLMYMAEAAKAKTKAAVVSANWCNAYYLRGFALLDLGFAPAAKLALEAAARMSPHNAQYLSELAETYTRQEDTMAAMRTFQRAEAAAREFSPDAVKNAELARAWRGMGYIFVEQGRLDDAEKMYRQCLDLDKNDVLASNEMQYIRSARAETKESRP